MKILNWNVETQEFSISKQKHKDLNNIIETLAKCNAIINIYECDLFYNNLKVLDKIKNLFIQYPSLMNIAQNFIDNIPKKVIKQNCSGLSMRIQNDIMQLFNEINKININDFDIGNINHIMISALSNEIIDKLIHKYLNEHKNEHLNYEKFKTEFLNKHPAANKRQCVIIANKIDFSKIFPNINNPQQYKFALNNNLLINQKGYLKLHESTNIPILVNDILPYSIWGFHLFFEQKQLKYFIFYCFNDIIIFTYRKGSVGLSKLDFYVAIPEMDENNFDKENLDLEEHNQYISNFLNSYLNQHQQFTYN